MLSSIVAFTMHVDTCCVKVKVNQHRPQAMQELMRRVESGQCSDGERQLLPYMQHMAASAAPTVRR
jgi:hypothetical protein